MKVTVLSRKDAESISAENFPENTAVISFFDPKIRRIDNNYRPVNYAGKTNHIYYVELNDLDLDTLPKYDMDYDTFFPEADDLADYIFECRDKGLDIICQCEYGQSRSAGCAAAILEYFEGNGISIFADFKYYPSQLVYHKVYDALNNYRNNRNDETF